MNKTKKEKNTGEAGRLYELELLVLFFQKAHHLQMDFHLGREVKTAGKFDDLVFRYKHKEESYSRYLQAKHCIHEDDRITSNVLFPSKHDKRIKNNLADKFHLDKYLTSFMVIRNHHKKGEIGQLKDLVIFTNVDFDYQELRNKGIDASSVSDDFIDFSTPERKGKLVKLDIDPNSQLCSGLKDCSDSFRLATELILQVKQDSENPKKRKHYIGVPDSMSSKYAKALLAEVIQISEDEITFQQKFLYGSSEISEKARIFREKLLAIAKEQYQYPEDVFLDKAGQAKLVATKSFQKGELADLPNEEITSEDIKEFFEILVLAVNQPNADQLRDLIADQELKKWFGYVDTSIIAEALEYKIFTWINENISAEGWICSKEGEEFFQKVNTMIVSITVSGLCIPYISSLLEVRCTGELFNVVIEFLKGDKCCLTIKSNEPFLTCSRLYGIVKERGVSTKEIKGVLFVNGILLQRKEARQIVLEAVKCTKSNLLVIEYTADCDVGIANQLLHATTEAKKKLIIVTPNDYQFSLEYQHTIDEITDEEVSFEDLSSESQARVLDYEVEFQGQPVKIEKLFDVKDTDAIARIVNSRTIARLIRDQGKVKIGKPIHREKEFEEEYYIERVFQYWLEVIREVKTELPRVPKLYNFNYKEYSEMNIYKLSSFPPEEQQILRCSKNFQTIKYEVREELLLLPEERPIIISDTAGMGKSTVLTSLSNQFKRRFPWKWVKRINLNDHTSTLAKYKRRKIESRDDAIQFFCKVFLEIGKDDEETKEELVYKYYVENKEKDMVIFLDGLDEICPDYKGAILKLIKVLIEKTEIGKLVVSTRPNMKMDLEYLLNVSAHSMEQFSVKQQIDFLTEFWYKRNPEKLIDKKRVRKFAETLINVFNQRIKDLERKLTGIPLQTKMIAAVFEKRKWKVEDSDDENYDSDDSKDDEQIGCSLEEYYCSEDSEPCISDNIDLATLYKQFVRIKYWDILESGKRLTDLTKPDVQDRVQISYEQFLSDYQLLSLSTILPEKYKSVLDTSQMKRIESLVGAIKTGKDKNGLVNEIVDGQPQFLHRTFAEYFFVELLIEHLQPPDDCGSGKLLTGGNWEKFVEFFFEEVLVYDEYETVRQFFDIRLGKVMTNTKEMTNKDLLTKPLLKVKNSAVHVAVAGNYSNILRFLEACFGDRITEVITYTGTKEVIEIAASKGNLEMVKWTVSKGLKIRDKKNLLHHSVQSLNRKFVEYLLNQYVKEGVSLADISTLINHKDGNGETPLQVASRSGNLEAMAILLQHGAQIHDRGKGDLTALLHAAAGGRHDTLMYLIENGADLQDINHQKSNVLLLASFGGNLESVKYLMSIGFSIHDENGMGGQALHFACQEGKSDIVQFLLEKGAHIHKKDTISRTALHQAAESGNVRTVKILLEHGAQIEEKDKNGATPLLHAAAGGKHDILLYLIEKGADLRSRDNEKSNVLHLASYGGNLETVKYLLSEGFDIHDENDLGGQALHFASGEGNADIVHFLLEEGADINKKDHEGRTPLHIASEFGNVKTIVVLLQNGAEINEKNREGLTALLQAAVVDKGDNLISLMENGADFRITNRNKSNILHFASQCGNVKTVEYLISKGLNIHEENASGCQALHFASAQGNADTVQYLLENGANINKKDDMGRTALHRASESGNIKTVEILLQNGADIHDKNNAGLTALLAAASGGKLDNVVYLAENGADLEDTSNEKSDVLLFAAYYGNLETVKYLLSKGCDIHKEDDFRSQALHLASAGKKADIVQYLVEKGANIHKKDNKGKTPLHVASEFGNIETVKILLQNGADMNEKDDHGLTALLLATRGGNYGVLIHLIENGANLQDKSKVKSDALQMASYSGDILTVEYLIHKGFDVHYENDMGRQALHFASAEGKANIVQFLLEKGANIHKKDSEGRTPLYYASCSGHVETEQILLHHGAKHDQNSSGCTAVLT